VRPAHAAEEMTMNSLIHSRLLCATALALLLAACSGQGPTGSSAQGDGADGEAGEQLPEGYGTLQLSLGGAPQPAPGAPLTVWVRILDAGDEGLVTERSRELGSSTVTLDTFYLPQGRYDVLVDLLDVDEAVRWSGRANNEVVAPGLLTGVSVSMSPAGGVQIEIDLASGGRRFVDSVQSEADQAPDAPQWLGWAGTQLTVSVLDQDSNEYVADTIYFGLSCHAAGSYRLHRASSPEGLLEAEAEMFSIPILGAGCRPATMAFAGERLYVGAFAANNHFQLCRGLSDRVVTRAVECFAPLPFESRANAEGYFDQALACGLLIDDQLNLFCAARAGADPLTTAALGVVHAWSPDGRDWSALLPYADGDAPDAAPTLDYLFPIATVGNWDVSSVAAHQLGGVYRLWLGGEDVQAAPDRPCIVGNTSSTDRERWPPMDVRTPGVLSSVHERPASNRVGFGVYWHAGRWESVWVDDTGDRYWGHGLDE